MATTTAQTEQAETEQLLRTWKQPPGVYGWFATVQNTPIATRFIGTTFLFFLLAGVMALVMRAQLAQPEMDLISAEAYNQLFTMHGTTMMFLFAVPTLEGFATLVLPFILGARELPFPRLTSFGLWAFFFGGLLFFSSVFFSAVPDAGWFAYYPLSGPEFAPGKAIDFWLLGLGAAEIAGIGAAIELTTGVLKSRAPGMTVNRIPIFGWAILVMALSMLFAFTTLIVATTLLELDRKFHTNFYDASGGGDPLLWQHLFWIFGHPEVYIQFIPAAAIISTIVPTLARRPIAKYNLLVLAIVGTGIMSFGLWVHHMFTTGLPLLGLSFFAAASFSIAIASGVQVFSWIATIWNGRPQFHTAFLFVLGFLFTFVMGGITGVMVAAVPFDLQVHDTFFVVAHFHYVLIGGVVFPVFAGFYYWFPQLKGTFLNERLGKWNFWLVFLGFHVTFFPMHISGLLGMPRRVYTYQAGLGLDLWNLISTIGAFILAVGIAIFVVNVVMSYKGGKPAGDNPWNAGTLEWAQQVPAPSVGFRTIPIVHSREPLWEQESFSAGDERNERIVHGMAEKPDHFRAAISSTVLDARPVAIMRLSGPSLWPVIISLALTVVFFAMIFNLYVVIAIGSVITLISAVGWAWPSREEREAIRAGDDGEYHGLPVWVSDHRSFHWWGMVLALTAIAIGLSVFIFSYYYLRSGVSAWPPDGISEPDLLLPALSSLPILASATSAWWASRSIRHGDQQRLKFGLIANIILAGMFLAIELYDLLTMDLKPSRTAYESLFATIGGVHAAIVVCGLIISLTVMVQAFLGYFTRQRNLAVVNVAMYWYFTVAAWIVVYGVLYLSPYVM